MKNKNFVLIVVLLVLIMLGVFYFKNQKLANLNRDDSKITEVDGWKSYYKENMISFKYPSDWKLDVSENIDDNLISQDSLAFNIKTEDFSQNENYEMLAGNQITLLKQTASMPTDLLTFEGIKQNLLGDFKNPIDEKIADFKEIKVKNGVALTYKAALSSDIIINGIVKTNDGYSYTADMVSKKEDLIKNEEIFNKFISSIEILTKVELQHFYISNIDGTKLFQKSSKSLDQNDWYYFAYELPKIDNVILGAEIYGGPEEVKFYYSLKNDSKKVLIGTVNSKIREGLNQWNINWQNIPNKDMYIWVETLKDGKKYISPKDRIFFE